MSWQKTFIIHKSGLAHVSIVSKHLIKETVNVTGIGEIFFSLFDIETLKNSYYLVLHTMSYTNSFKSFSLSQFLDWNVQIFNLQCKIYNITISHTISIMTSGVSYWSCNMRLQEEPPHQGRVTMRIKLYNHIMLSNHIMSVVWGFTCHHL